MRRQSNFDRETLLADLIELGITPQIDVFKPLAIAYREPTRHYHSQHHITDCLRQLDRVRHLAEHPAAIAIAIWFHDAVYNPRRTDNEALSAQWASEYLTSVGVDPGLVASISTMILATKTHASTNSDIDLMLDIDLSILGADPEHFEAYDRAIRQEYAWVPEAQYRAARRNRLSSFLTRDAIFTTREFRQRYERQAQENLRHKVSQLSA
ncbi:N-methyl-D-aspartate receptor NMDAR2C subunit [Nodosilinea sp. LEGE 07088]|uniref:HD domain-containing protein n=1 Tax=Nodosilinea sp. LEGE 07088 TaxID=2777968 RepID=UPI001882AE53|nr:N-methyl-D-aspartate receptor NMDAR2C subunit [Nodosilinea sp. LEGE 07088]MBE9137183.1 N-methyl-D-aspartate receptor NMDAR2C subunit [Nodosilinea sp. LEGE 07088]